MSDNVMRSVDQILSDIVETEPDDPMEPCIETSYVIGKTRLSRHKDLPKELVKDMKYLKQY